MSISFSEIPADNLVPMFMTEFDNSNAAKGGAMPWKNLLIGQALSANSANAGTLKLITSDEQADALVQGDEVAGCGVVSADEVGCFAAGYLQACRTNKVLPGHLLSQALDALL